jgi:AcrR family transcriptional regulator
MRVTAITKQATRQRILDVAQALFRSQGFEATTTRDIAREAAIATGTLFNYFPTKEAIVASLVADALGHAQEDAGRCSQEASSLEEAPFAHVAAELRRLKPFRKYVGPLLETALSPLASAASHPEGEALRVRHLATVADLMSQHGLGDAMTPVACQLYWSLYIGVLAFWTQDTSPHQEDTLALLDESMRMFALWLIPSN